MSSANTSACQDARDRARGAGSKTSAWSVSGKTSATSPSNENSTEGTVIQTSGSGAGSSAASGKAGSPGSDVNAVSRVTAVSPAPSTEVSGGKKSKSREREAKIRAARMRLRAWQERSNETAKEADEAAATAKEGCSNEGGTAEACTRPAVDDRATGPGSGAPEAAMKQADGAVDGVSGRAAAEESSSKAGKELTQVVGEKSAPAHESGDRVGRRCDSGAAGAGSKEDHGAGREDGTGAGSVPGAPPATNADQRQRRRREI